MSTNNRQPSCSLSDNHNPRSIPYPPNTCCSAVHKHLKVLTIIRNNKNTSKIMINVTYIYIYIYIVALTRMMSNKDTLCVAGQGTSTRPYNVPVHQSMHANCSNGSTCMTSHLRQQEKLGCEVMQAEKCR